MKGVTPYLILVVLAIGAVMTGLAPVAADYGVARSGVLLRIRTFPPDAELRAGGAVLAPTRTEESWREYFLAPDDPVPVLSAPGYRDRHLHLFGETGIVVLEERLLPHGGPLRELGEFPTGAAPKSVAFLPGNRLVIPLLRDQGVDFFSWRREHGTVVVKHLGTEGPPGGEPGAFVESLVLTRRREVWVSRMEPDEIHRFDLDSRRWIESTSSGGTWPKTMVVSEDGGEVYVANWLSETVAVLDSSSGAVMETIPVRGQPRGMWLSRDGRWLWVCIFSTGDIEIIDTARREVVHRMGLPRGAARHIVSNPDGSRLYYSDMMHGTVSIIDPATRTVVRSRYVGPNVNTIVADPRGRYLFASVRGRNNQENYLLPGPEHGRIAVLDAETLQAVQTIWGRRQPTGLAVSPDGLVLAATDFLDNNLALYQVR